MKRRRHASSLIANAYLKWRTEQPKPPKPWGCVGGESNIEELQYNDLVDFVTEINAANRSTGPHMQGVLNLLDNRDADGGTQLVPGFNKALMHG
eukprot:gene9783-7761_t